MPVAMQEFLVSSRAQTDTVAELLIDKGTILQLEFLQKISEASDGLEHGQSNEAIKCGKAMFQIIHSFDPTDPKSRSFMIGCFSLQTILLLPNRDQYDRRDPGQKSSC